VRPYARQCVITHTWHEQLIDRLAAAATATTAAGADDHQRCAAPQEEFGWHARYVCDNVTQGSQKQQQQQQL
jgi:hypothetical protein